MTPNVIEEETYRGRLHASPRPALRYGSQHHQRKCVPLSPSSPSIYKALKE